MHKVDFFPTHLHHFSLAIPEAKPMPLSQNAVIFLPISCKVWRHCRSICPLTPFILLLFMSFGNLWKIRISSNMSEMVMSGEFSEEICNSCVSSIDTPRSNQQKISSAGSDPVFASGLAYEIKMYNIKVF